LGRFRLGWGTGRRARRRRIDFRDGGGGRHSRGLGLTGVTEARSIL